MIFAPCHNRLPAIDTDDEYHYSITMKTMKRNCDYSSSSHVTHRAIQKDREPVLITEHGRPPSTSSMCRLSMSNRTGSILEGIVRGEREYEPVTDGQEKDEAWGVVASCAE